MLHSCPGLDEYAIAVFNLVISVFLCVNLIVYYPFMLCLTVSGSDQEKEF